MFTETQASRVLLGIGAVVLVPMLYKLIQLSDVNYRRGHRLRMICWQLQKLYDPSRSISDADRENTLQAIMGIVNGGGDDHQLTYSGPARFPETSSDHDQFGPMSPQEKAEHDEFIDSTTSSPSVSERQTEHKKFMDEGMTAGQLLSLCTGRTFVVGAEQADERRRTLWVDRNTYVVSVDYPDDVQAYERNR